MGTIADKLNYLNNTKAQIKNEINKIGGNITNETTFRNYVTSLNSIYSKLPKVEGEGSNLTLENCEDATLLLTPEGNASQETTGGKNLLNTLNINGTFSNVQVTTNPDKSITLNGTCTSNYAINIITNWSLSLENGKTYILSGCPDLVGKDPLFLELYSNSPSNQYITDIGSGKSFTLTTDRTYRCYIAIKSGKTYDNVTLYPMVEEGSIATEYEPYTGGQPSPNPDYPQPIKVVTGEQNVEISGKNLFDKNAITNLSTFHSTAAINDDKSITITSSASNGYAIIRPFFNFKANKTYTISFDVDDVSKFNHMYLFVSTSTTAGGYSKNPYVTITKTADVSLGIGIYPNENATITISNIQIEENSERTQFEPYYTPQNYPLSLGNIELARINDYKDFIFKNELGSPYYNADLELHSWYKHNAIYKYVVTGNEIFNNSFGVNLFKMRDDFEQVPFVTGYGLSNYYKYNSIQSGINGNTSNGDFVLQYDRGYCSLFFKNTSFDNVTDFKNDLQDKYNNDNPIIIMFPLENPIDTQITDTTLVSQLENINNNARSYSDTTIIICSSESEDNETIQASVTALKDISTLFEQVNDAIIEIGGGE